MVRDIAHKGQYKGDTIIAAAVAQDGLNLSAVISIIFDTDSFQRS